MSVINGDLGLRGMLLKRADSAFTPTRCSMALMLLSMDMAAVKLAVVIVTTVLVANPTRSRWTRLSVVVIWRGGSLRATHSGGGRVPDEVDGVPVGQLQPA